MTSLGGSPDQGADPCKLSGLPRQIDQLQHHDMGLLVVDTVFMSFCETPLSYCT
jgi:hypothetical protein